MSQKPTDAENILNDISQNPEQQDREGQASEAASEGLAPRIEALEAEVSAERAEKEKFRDEVLRRIAEFENFRKQKERESMMAASRMEETIIRSMLPVLDDANRILANAPAPESVPEELKAYVDGVALLKKNLDRWLEERGVKAIEAIGEKLDVNFHEAISQVEYPGHESETVIEEYQTGYLLGDKVIRHAKVIVSR